jgi:hypothetical protein
MPGIYLILVLISLGTGLAAQTAPGTMAITRLQYGGGGDWYADPSSLPNLIKFAVENVGLRIAPEERRAAIGEDDFFSATYFYLTGHGNIYFSDEEAGLLRTQLLSGAFLHADDNYGMDGSFKREMQKVFPDKEWVELPVDHPIYSVIYDFPNGLPKIHEHDNQPPQGLALFHEGRIVVFYSFETDLGDGW